MAWHSEGGYVLQELAGVERMEDAYGREVLVLHFKKDAWSEKTAEPVAVLLANYGAPSPPFAEGLEWLMEAVGEFGEEGKWGTVPTKAVGA
jgi:hypothetical protein